MSLRLAKRAKRHPGMFRTRKRVLEGLRAAAVTIWGGDEKALPTSTQTYQQAIEKHEPVGPGKARRLFPSGNAILNHFESMNHAWLALGYEVETTARRVMQKIITPEIHTKLKYIYEHGDQRKDRPADCPTVREYAAQLSRSLGRELGHHLLCQYAAKQGWVKSKEPNWTRAELKLLEKYAHLSPERIQLYMDQAGFHRTVVSIRLMRKRRNAHKGAPYYSATAVCKLLGVDNHKFERGWLVKYPDELKYELKGTARSEKTRQHGDVKLYHVDILRDFFCNHPEEIDLSKVDKIWFLWLVTNGRVKMVASSQRLSRRTEGYKPELVKRTSQVGGLWAKAKDKRSMNTATAQLTLTGPSVKRFQSEQVVSTPWEFIRAVEKKFGALAWDLAATDDNAKAPRWITPEQDTFKQDWADLLEGGLGWLNPEFDPMVVSVRKCALEQQRGAEFLLLSPASISTNWFWDHVQPFATVYSITPRICFDGSHNVFPKDHPRAGERKCDPSCVGCCPYPKDLMLSHYCANPSHELQRWKWK